MTDKEIIIDGVNVVRCEYFWNLGDAEGLKICKMNFDNNYFSNGIPSAKKCGKIPKCYYKQLRRKEQEYEELKETINKFSQGVILPMPEPEIINLADYYKQALKKIEELATNGYLKDSRFCEAKELQQILTIINEVKNNDE